MRRMLLLLCLGLLLLCSVGCQTESTNHQVELAPPPKPFTRSPQPTRPPDAKPRLKDIRPVAPDEPAPRPGAKTPTLSQTLSRPSKTTSPADLASRPKHAPGVHSPGTPRIVYRIRKGDTFWSIANRQLGNGKRWRELAALNPQLDLRSLPVGQAIYLPAN